MQEKAFQLDIPGPVREICAAIAKSGERAYVVGGAVRDWMRGDFSGDYDLATTATPKKILGLFKKVVATGEKHGTVTVLQGGYRCEVTTLRGEGPYSDGRRPDRVEFLSDIEADLARRDFTVNAMAWDPEEGRLRDPFGGAEDIGRRLLRAVGDPEERFREDGLRVLRAARFAATLDFAIDPATRAAMPAAAPALARISAERKRDELRKLLSAPRPSKGLEIIHSAGLLPFVCPALQAMAEREGGDRLWAETRMRVDAVPAALELRLAAMLLDLGPRGADGRRTESAAPARRWLAEMRFDKKTGESAAHLISKSGFDGAESWSDADIRRFMRDAGRGALADCLSLRRADLAAQSALQEASPLLDRLAEKFRAFAGTPLSVQELQVDGKALMEALGLAPGPGLGALLSQLLEHVIERPEDNRRARLIALARSMPAASGERP